MMLNTASAAMIGAAACASTGNSGITSRKKPYAPSLSSTPASSIDPAVGASVCASGSQVWNGQIGTLMANAITKAQNAMFFTVSNGMPNTNVPANVGHFAAISGMLYVPNADQINWIDSNMPTEPAIV